MPLGVLLKNESIGAEMIEILQSIQENYVPIIEQDNGGEKTKTVIRKIFLGGDNLTEERARNLQGAMSDGDSEYENLTGIIPKNEDWHAIRYMYQVGNKITNFQGIVLLIIDFGGKISVHLF